jgi:hypothetical protein
MNINEYGNYIIRTALCMVCEPSYYLVGNILILNVVVYKFTGDIWCTY